MTWAYKKSELCVVASISRLLGVKAWSYEPQLKFDDKWPILLFTLST